MGRYSSFVPPLGPLPRLREIRVWPKPDEVGGEPVGGARVVVVADGVEVAELRSDALHLLQALREASV